MIKNAIAKWFGSFKASLLREDKRESVQLRLIFGLLIIVSTYMSVVNVFTGKWPLLIATASFAVICVFDFCLSFCGKIGLKISSWLLMLELVVLFVFFIVSGIPEGFSAIWVCLVPSCGLLLFRRKQGSFLCVLMFVILIFFFRTNIGQSFLQYDYTQSFRLRFPMLYLAFFGLSFFLESILEWVNEELRSAQKKYEYLYVHDALTDVFNRYGFNECLAQIAKKPPDKSFALMILDLDHFKSVNDRLGHLNGDVVLREVAALLVEYTGDSDVVCRWGGEEFAILFGDGKKAISNAFDILNALRKKKYIFNQTELTVTGSIGLVIADGNRPVSPIALVAQADACLYRAKKTGRNRVISAPLVRGKDE